jgi:hypothetical protein
MNCPRWFEIVTKDGQPIHPDDCPDRDKGKLWDPKWRKHGLRKTIVLFELIKSEPKDYGYLLTFACPGPYFIKFPWPNGKLGLDVDRCLDAAKEPTGAVKLVPDGGGKASNRSKVQRTGLH